MNVIKLMLVVMLFFGTSSLVQARKKSACVRAKLACAQQCSYKPRSNALRPRTRRCCTAECPPPEYGLYCDSCCYQAYGTPGYFPNAFRPYYGDGYFGRRPGNFNFAW